MSDEKLRNVEDLRRALRARSGVMFKRQGRGESYRWVEETLRKFGYLHAGKSDRGVIKEYLQRMTGYSRAQVTRLIGCYRRQGHVREATYRRHRFARQYAPEDIRLLAETDRLHGFPNAAAIKRVLHRMGTVYGDGAYGRIAEISVAHIYNLRKSVSYQRLTHRYRTTRPVQITIGERRRPQPDGLPGYLRVDTVHQGDRDGQKGVYHINTVDEVTQFECLAAVERINEQILAPMLLRLVAQYPFRIREFHADNGSEYINHVVVNLLGRLLIRLTKSRPRQANDNALVETKNGWVLRKWIGYQFIGQHHATRVNAFYSGCFNEYVNFHRPCAFPVQHLDAKGRITRRYPYHGYCTPYEKLKALPDGSRHLKPGVTFPQLDRIAGRKTDNDMARFVQQERDRLFAAIESSTDPRLPLQAHP